MYISLISRFMTVKRLYGDETHPFFFFFVCRYLLVPFYLGEIYMKVNEMDRRLDCVNKAIVRCHVSMRQRFRVSYSQSNLIIEPTFAEIAEKLCRKLLGITTGPTRRSGRLGTNDSC